MGSHARKHTHILKANVNLLIRFLLGLHYRVGVLQKCHMGAAAYFICSQRVGHQSAVEYNTHHMCSLA